MPGGNEVQWSERNEVELQRQLPVNPFALLLRNPVPFVHRDDQGAPPLESNPEHARILFSHGVVSVEDHDDDVRLINRLQSLGNARTLNDILDLGTPADTSGVDEHEFTAVALERHEDAVTGRPGLFVRDHPFVADEAVHQRGLADIGPADDGDPNRVPLVIVGDLRLQPLQYMIHQIAAPLSVGRRNQEGLTQRQRMEVDRSRIEVEPFPLVECQRHRLAGTAQLPNDEVILGSQALADIDQEHEAIGLFNSALRLLAHLRLDADGILNETAGVDDDVRNRPETAESVLPVARQPGHVRDDRIAGACKNVEQRGLADIGSAHERDDGQHTGVLPVALSSDPAALRAFR